MIFLYLAGGAVALLGFAIWKLIGTTPTDIIGMGLFGVGILIAGCIELVGLLTLPFRILNRNSIENVRQRKAAHAANERAAAQHRAARREHARRQAAAVPNASPHSDAAIPTDGAPAANPPTR